MTGVAGHHLMWTLRFFPMLWIATVSLPMASRLSAAISDGDSIQKALDAHPGAIISLPAGDYTISQPIRFTGKNSGLCGPGRIIQANPKAAILEITQCDDVQIRNLTLLRPEGKMESSEPGIHVTKSRNVVLSNIEVFDNRSDLASILIENCGLLQISDCVIQNYSRIAIDDRTAKSDYGYAFNCINGAWIIVRNTKNMIIKGNRIIETVMIPSPELKAKYHLGDFVKKNAQKGRVIRQQDWDAAYVNNWHQGSALQVTSPEVSDSVQILDNYIENAAQGIDIHADHVIVAQNIVNNAFIGMKAMHGSRNVLIIGNQFIKNDLWSIGLMPGTNSHDASASIGPAKPALGANIDGHSIISNNIISDFGYGNAHWMWEGSGTPLKFDSAPLPGQPPLRNVLVQGNVIYNTGRDQVIVDGVPKIEPPRYKYAVTISGGDGAPQGLHFLNNLLDPGTAGVSGAELTP